MARNTFKTWPLAAKRLWIGAMMINGTVLVGWIVTLINHTINLWLVGLQTILTLLAVGCLMGVLTIHFPSKQRTSQDNPPHDGQE